jgi:hypothetical protein
VVKLCGEAMNGSSPLSLGTLSGVILLGGMRGLGPGDVNRERVFKKEDRRFPLVGPKLEELNGSGGSDSEGKASRNLECKELISEEERMRVR